MMLFVAIEDFGCFIFDADEWSMRVEESSVDAAVVVGKRGAGGGISACEAVRVVVCCCC